jgi:hypothetical protein
MRWRPFSFELSLAAILVAVLSLTLILIAVLAATPLALWKMTHQRPFLSHVQPASRFFVFAVDSGQRSGFQEAFTARRRQRGNPIARLWPEAVYCHPALPTFQTAVN